MLRGDLHAVSGLNNELETRRNSVIYLVFHSTEAQDCIGGLQKVGHECVRQATMIYEGGCIIAYGQSQISGTWLALQYISPSICLNWPATGMEVGQEFVGQATNHFMRANALLLMGSPNITETGQEFCNISISKCLNGLAIMLVGWTGMCGAGNQ